MSRKRKQSLPLTPITATTRALSHDGRGIANINGKATFISFALAHEDVMFTYSKKHGTFDEGILTSVTKPSSDRVTPPCTYFGTCGGCALQHLAPAQQVQHKQTVFLEQLQAIAGVQPLTLLPPLTAKQTGYRRKARLGVKYVIKKEKLFIGFRELDARYLTDMDSCEILEPSVGKQITLLTDLVSSLKAFDHIPQIEIAVGDDITALIFRHLKPFEPEDIEKLIALGKNHGFAIYLQPKGPDTIHKLHPNDGQDLLTYRLPDLNLTYFFHPVDFIQVNREMNIKMVNLALELLDIKQDETVLDLFCGLGNFSLPLAQRAKHVLAIEGDDLMVKRAQMNANYNNISNVDFHMENLFNLEQPRLKMKFDKILLDPPRAGASEIMPQLAQNGAKAILYISCNPATLARDSKILINHGYKLDKAGIMDMFPHTSHVEAIALFVKKG